MILTERLKIRNHTIDDLDWLSRLYSDEKAMYYLPDMLTKDRAAVRLKLLDILAEEKTEDRLRFFYCIELKNVRKCIGEIGFTIYAENGEDIADLGYFIFPEYWRNGFVTEAAKAVIKFAFEKYGVSRTIATCYRENAGSERVMQKCGMHMVEGSVCKRLHNGIEKDRVMYEICRG